MLALLSLTESSLVPEFIINTFDGRSIMKVLLPVGVFLTLFFTPYGQSVYEDLYDVDLADLEESLLSDNKTLFSKNETLEETNDKQSKEITFEAVTEDENAEDDEIKNGGADTCGKPLLIKNTKIAGNERPPYVVGTSLSYSCEFGYSADGASHTSTCLVTESYPTWSDPQIVCIPRSCGDPGFLPNAHRIGSRFTFPNSVEFECDEGYELQGTNIRYCQVNGRWSGSLPSCKKIFCDNPDHPENGRVTFSSLEYGSQLRYECDKGYILKNHQPRICSANGTWSWTDPICVDAQCDPAVAPEHGFVETVGGIPRVGSIALYTCQNGRRLIGSGTSKCLDIGEWTFPTPKCVEPCNVPIVLHGHIGKYKTQRYRSQKLFVKMDPGTNIEDGEEIFLRCDSSYEAMGRNTGEARVTCDRGEWKEIPVCQQANCRSEPPNMDNGRVSTVNRQHGGYVVYNCNTHFLKTKYGNVTCHFGSWRGITPICTDQRCYVNKIQFPGLVKGGKNVYLNKESFIPTCDKGYEVAKQDNKLVCDRGEWKGHFPPCMAASCLTAPPVPAHGRVKDYSELHSSTVTYECDEDYLLHSQSQVLCLFGEWKGNLPVCKDSRCNFTNLKMKTGVINPAKDFVRSGETLDVQCAPGYSRLSVKPLCTKGEWTEYGSSPCKANNCNVAKIDNGAITDETFKRKLTFRGYVNERHFEAVRIGTVKVAGSSLYVFCNSRFSFQGKNQNNVKITCSEGKWQPTPVCLLPGAKFEEAVTSSFISQDKSFVEQPTTTSTTAAPPKQTEHRISQPESNEPIANRASKENPCSCTYQKLDDLIAYSGNELLQANSKVKNGSIVKFYCRNFGYSRLVGPTEITCNACKTWHSSEFPSCTLPLRGDAILQMLDQCFKILPGGILGLNQGIDAKIACFGNGVASQPQWLSPVSSNSFAFETTDYPGGQERISSFLVIKNSSYVDNGLYQCSLQGYRPTFLEIQVITQCRMFEENADFEIYYDMKLNVNSSAMFTCKDRSKKLEGSSVLTCLSNGRWSGDPPKCISHGCPKLEEKDGMLITYSQELKVGTTATFHCFTPHVRKGESNIKCLRNGVWSGTLPSCTLPRCPLANLFEHIPENVVPVMENVNNDTLPHGFLLHLTCEGNLRLSERTTAKCGNEGLWEVPKVRCVPGCNAIEKELGSQLIIEPEKDFYRFGEFVAFSCAPGQTLNTEVEILMCLRDGWSETDIPTCIDVPMIDESIV